MFNQQNAPAVSFYIKILLFTEPPSANSEQAPAVSSNGNHFDELLNHNSSADTQHHERYQVFHFNFDGVQAAYVVSLWIFIASIAKIGKKTGSIEWERECNVDNSHSSIAGC